MAMRFHLLSLFGLLAVASTVHAQQLYKCGNTYSQTPCANDAKPAKLQQWAAPDKSPGASGFELCAAKARSTIETPEPETARIQPMKQRVSEVIQYAGQPLSSHRYDLSVDAKTRYGVFSGPIPYSCWLSEDQARVLQFGPRRAP